MKKNTKFIVIAIIILLIFILCNGYSSDTENFNTTDNEIKNENNNKNIYATDDIINKFITEYNNTSPYKITDLKQGNIKTKYYGNSNDCYVELLNANNTYAKAFNITINGKNEDIYIDRILNIYKYVIKILNSNLTEEEITTNINTLKEQTHQYSFDLGENLQIVYTPIVELSTGKTDCKIELSSTNYK